MGDSQNMTMPMPMSSQIIRVGHEIYTINVYWIAICSLWVYDYLLTFPDEVEYAWRGKKTRFYWLYVLNRYLPLCFIIVNLVANSSDAWTPEICSHYSGMKAVAVMLTTFVAEIIITLRVYALCHGLKMVLAVSGTLMAGQWAIVIFIVSQTWNPGKQFQTPLGSLLNTISTTPELMKNQIFHYCMNIKAFAFPEYLVAVSAVSLAFDTLAFITIMGISIHSRRAYGVYTMMRTVQRDGAMYFFAMFSGNLTWLLLVLYAPGVLKIMQVEPTFVISGIMINRITLNLKRAGQKDAEWSMQTFGQSQFA
ncbi:hypothetical protein CPC08DRAFT_715674 [Agrocybe pediades]|nr:hypothetical protein CPC08DRAFT_715674 [Agrocybe pediades]